MRNYINLSILLMMIIIVPFTTLSQPNYYVDCDALGDNDGSSWEDAFTSLENALNTAHGGGDIIWVAQGTYKPTSGRNVPFDLYYNVQLYGGFDGTETKLNERDFENNTTILSGDIGTQGSASDNKYHVIEMGGNTKLDGFTISDGYANGDSYYYYDRGGAVFIDSYYGSRTGINIANCNFSDNYAYYRGGSVYLWGNNDHNISITFENVSFSENSTNSYKYGGAIAIIAEESSEIAINIENGCEFTSNSSGYGAAIYASAWDNGSSIEISADESKFMGNHAAYRGGAVRLYDEGVSSFTASFTNCLISGNKANSTGGALAFGAENTTQSLTTEFTNCTFTANYSPSGGVFDLYETNSGSIENSVTNSIIYSNNSIISFRDNGGTLSSTYAYSEIEGSNGSGAGWDSNLGIDGGNNYDFDPLFESPINYSSAPTISGDFHLKDHSLAIGAGTNSGAPATDIEGNERPAPDGSNVDLGAYENELGSPTIVWDGSESSAWNTATNWNANTVPDEQYSIIIPGSLANYPVITTGIGAVCNDLTVNNEASFTVESGGSLITYGTTSGSINTKLDITANDWHLISSPVGSAVSGMFEYSYLQTWSESTQLWQDISSLTEPLTAAKGFSLWYEDGSKGGGTTVTFSGTPHTGSQSRSLSYHENTDPDKTADGLNLVGNPYPSSIDWASLQPSYGTAYIWNPATTNYIYNTDSDIAPMQGFFVYTTNDGSNFALDNENRSHGGSFYKNSSGLLHGIVLGASYKNHFDELRILFDNTATDGFELTDDSWKLISSGAGVSQLWSYSPSGKLAIDKRPETEIIQLGFANNEAGIYTIGIKEITDINTAILEDTKLNIFHKLTEGDYNFDWSLNDDETRFKLHLNTTAVDEISDNTVQAYVAGGNIIIQNEMQTERILLTDITGRTLGVWENMKSIPAPKTAGVYLVTVVSENQMLTKKIIIE